MGGGQCFKGAAFAAIILACVCRFLGGALSEWSSLTAPLLYRIKMEFLCVDFEQIANKKSSDEYLRIFVVVHCQQQSNL